ncbi:MAG: hypothetical protein WBP93_20795 [Pyrinomonadaceae bacterium]
MSVALPLTVSLADPAKPASVRSHRRHSRAWWRKHRARMRRLRTQRAHQRALAAKATLNSLLASSDHTNIAGNTNAASAVAPVAVTTNAAPAQWKLAVPQDYHFMPGGGEMRFRAVAPDGKPAGQVAITMLNLNTRNVEMLPLKEQRRMLGGVPFTELRGTVIDKMVNANGWVINDLERNIGGRRVYLVVAQTGASGDGRTPPQSWVFYFTEVDRRIYSLVTNVPTQFSDQMDAESERLLSSFPAQQH